MDFKGGVNRATVTDDRNRSAQATAPVTADIVPVPVPVSSAVPMSLVEKLRLAASVIIASCVMFVRGLQHPHLAADLSIFSKRQTTRLAVNSP
jgi:hypothetical protein